MALLKKGQIIDMVQSGRCEVIDVNESRAVVRSLKTIHTRITTAAGKVVEFEAAGRMFSISPNSDVDILPDVKLRS